MLKKTFLTQCCIGLALLFSSKAFSYTADLSPLAANKAWHALLHMRQHTSLIDDTRFFFSPIGSTDPLAELEATLAAFQTNPQSQCKFPARAAWLATQLPDFSPFPTQQCPELSTFLDNVPADTFSLVFASEKNPSSTSMMGHLLLKIAGKKGERTPVHALSFAANLHNRANALTFIPQALFSGADGVFTLEPFAQKSAHYRTEGRKLYEYPLAFTEEERQRLLLHIWEMKGLNVAYSLSQHNCASALITLLRVGRDHIGSILYKPFITPFDLLDESVSRHRFLTPPSHMLPKQSRSASLELATGQKNDHATTQITLRPAYNALMENNAAYGKEVGVDLFTARFDYTHHNQTLRPESFTFYRSQTYVPTTGEDFQFSRKVEAALLQDNQAQGTALYPTLGFGVGIAAETGLPSLLPYVFLNTAYLHYEDKHTLTLAPELGIFWYPTPKVKLHAQTTHFVTTNTAPKDNTFSLQGNYYLRPNLAFSALFEKTHTPHTTTQAFMLGFRLHY